MVALAFGCLILALLLARLAPGLLDLLGEAARETAGTYRRAASDACCADRLQGLRLPYPRLPLLSGSLRVLRGSQAIALAFRIMFANDDLAFGRARARVGAEDRNLDLTAGLGFRRSRKSRRNRGARG